MAPVEVLHQRLRQDVEGSLIGAESARARRGRAAIGVSQVSGESIGGSEEKSFRSKLLREYIVWVRTPAAAVDFVVALMASSCLMGRPHMPKHDNSGSGLGRSGTSTCRNRSKTSHSANPNSRVNHWHKTLILSEKDLQTKKKKSFFLARKKTRSYH